MNLKKTISSFQLKIGKKKTQKELKAIKEIPSIKKEVNHETSANPTKTKENHGYHDTKGRVINGR